MSGDDREKTRNFNVDGYEGGIGMSPASDLVMLFFLQFICEGLYITW